MAEISIQVNGRQQKHEAEPRTHLGDFIREKSRLTGTNLSCEHGVCGACTVLVDGRPVRSCITFAGACDGHEVTTVEGYDDDPIMSRLRTAFSEKHALQCGFCTPGMLATSRDIVLRLPDADEARVRIELSGNICRCTGYQGITAAILSVLQALRDQPDAQVEALRAAVVQNVPQDWDQNSFTTFDAVQEEAQMPAPVAAAAPGNADKGKGQAIQGGFDARFPADQVWAFMKDLPKVAACLPGAIIESQEGATVQGKIAIKFGPMSAAFKGNATLEEDNERRAAVLRGEGVDSLSQSRARGDVSYQVQPDGQERSRVHVELVYSLQGPLAQFSRSGLVQDFVRRMIAEFGKNVNLRLENPLAEGHEPVVAEFNPVKMFFSILWDRFKGLFRRA
ncbi:xanthine dehydrogenase family Fe-S subunit [Alcaligenes ammonioxydans]|uniref:2Fe-2S iron-sulfur cluster binding domain-containing protein n=1 Tax=Alcaligenes ammonioxydans TaxID=2582914 RepID=A0ABX8SVF1_9BURK|nr:2Fe-2S iron-sulfur cluster-binding protein [Alcaligenes ammonioxydans]QBH18901.1 2Fe-2S iron-sulfur cluster binding domain-containing protein [Alcaligenes faecalis]QXX80011.1 2Fe-2S iron-sulfur cluster binding domain-containing protein [Alcaligenes ammonioxydans]